MFRMFFELELILQAICQETETTPKPATGRIDQYGFKENAIEALTQIVKDNQCILTAKGM